MCKFKMTSVTVYFSLFICMWLVTGLSSAADFQTKSASVPAPGVVVAPLTARAIPPADPQAERERRQARLRRHHLPGPLGQAPQAVVRAAPPPTVMATAVVPVAATTITFDSNRPIPDSATSDLTSHVNEPSLAVRGSEILYTGNWYAAFSTDGGTNFTYVNPATTFPTIPGQPFCCDQVALYDPTHDLMFWYLQYVKDATGNTVRLAVAHGNDIYNQQWRFYDFTPQGVGNWSNQWFDFPDMAVGEKYLYITTNVFNISNQFTRALILRLPLDKLAAYQGFTYNYFDTSQDFSLRPTQGATDTMYFGSHITTNSLRVFSWPENSTTISSDDVTVQVWSNATRVAPGPDGRDWLGRADHRITAAWLGGNEVGFAWTASQDGNYPFPHVRVAVLNKNTKAVTAQPHIWNSNFAFAYPAAATNSNGEVGISVHYGGGAQLYPSHAVGVLDSSSSNWVLATTATGTHGPSENLWGDYLAVRPHGQATDSWVATGFTLQGGPQSNNVEPRYIHFRVGEPPLKVSLVNLEPDKRLKKDETTTFRATVTRGGATQAGETVNFSTANTSLATVSPATKVTNASGVAETTVRGESRWEKTTTMVTATVNGAIDSKPVKVPDLSVPGLVLLVICAVLFGLRRKRSKST